ncbi:transposase [Chryseobacterium luteum]|uniref:Transposase n=1 Tax=Chryseobacterium luteum TaxID=421531 RepID=A0A085ZX06_9FLAO|nr:transposase [Chryseobacterium luteum]KFF08970.1 transposase [Chryseobacterium luteum]
MNLKQIHIGSLVKTKVEELRIPSGRIMNYLHCTEDEIEGMYLKESMETQKLLKWSKLLQFDFFRIYTGHLILYAPPTRMQNSIKVQESTLTFRKSVYTEEVKMFMLDKIMTGEMTVNEIVKKYKIPRTTLYKWVKKV